MDDRQIQELARMVMEAESLEGSDAPIAFPAHHAHGPVRRILIGAGLGLAAAACLVIGFIAMQPARPAAKGGARALTDAHKSPTPDQPAIVPAAAEQCVLMSMFRDPSGHCSCLQVSEPQWEGGRALADVSRSELRRVALREPCDTEAQQVLIVAVSSRADTLPRSHEQAEAIAQQLSTAAASVGRHTDVSTFARAAMPGLSDSATVVAETVPMRQPSRVKDLLEGATGVR